MDATIRAQGLSETQRISERFRCAGVRCTGTETGAFVDLDGVGNIVAVPRNVRLGSSAGFDTTTYSVDSLEAVGDLVNEFPGLRIDRLPSATVWGFWGEYGVGAITAFSGNLSGRYDGVAFSGTMSGATSLALGETSGTNPGGIGSATWDGVAEAVSLRSYGRQQGTARIEIAALANPRASVDVRLRASIGSAAWETCRFPVGNTAPAALAGTSGRGISRPNHEETYGVFDTGTWVGAFGAKRM